MVTCDFCQKPTKKYLIEPVESKKVCPACSVTMDLLSLERDGDGILFYNKNANEVCNKPNTIRFSIIKEKDGRGITGNVKYLWFKINDSVWLGKVYGEQSSIVISKRLKQKKAA